MQSRTATHALIATIVVIASACSPGKEVAPMPESPPVGIRLESPDMSYHLDPSLKTALDPMFDAEALERLLRWLHPNYRADYIGRFIPQTGGEPFAIIKKGTSAVIPRLSFPVGSSDPVLQGIIEEIWAPYWAGISDEELARLAASPIPGLTRAKQQRGLRAAMGDEGRTP